MNTKAYENDIHKHNRVLIIGAGASGLMAALVAAWNGAYVTVLEHGDKPGRKLALTGNGRCNYTNTDVNVSHYHSSIDILNAAYRSGKNTVSEAYHGSNKTALAAYRSKNNAVHEVYDGSNDTVSETCHGTDDAASTACTETEDFVSIVLDEFGFDECIYFFRELCIEPDIRHYAYDDSGYVYPKGMNAAEFRDELYDTAAAAGVEFRFGVNDAEVIRIAGKNIRQITPGVCKAEDRKDKYCGSEKLSDSDTEVYDAVIIAAGSNAYPSTGSDSSVYPLLRSIGARFHTFQPALCALYSKDAHLKEMKGKRIRNTVSLIIYYQEPVRSDEQCSEIKSIPGDSNSADNGFTGERKPSQSAEYTAAAGSNEANISMIPDGKENVLSVSYESYGEIQFNEHSISGIPVMQLSRYAAIALKQGHRVTLTTAGHEYDIHRTAGFDRAQVCSGGVDVRDIDPHTMRFKDTNVYICGELLDVDGDCGGYNLHFAWATGSIAGYSAGTGTYA